MRYAPRESNRDCLFRDSLCLREEVFIKPHSAKKEDYREESTFFS